MKHRSNSGFTLLEIVTVVFVVGIMMAVLAPLGAELMDADRSSRTQDELARIYTAIVGNPAAGTFGYLADVGDYPASLLDLVQNPGLTGWEGPYLTDVHIEGNILYDLFGSPYEYYNPTSLVNVKDQLVIISRGPDRASTFNNTGSPNPNQRANFNGTDPTGNYIGGSGNSDNIVYPRFLDNPGLKEYESLGTFSLDIMTIDYNASLPGRMPGCPGMFRVTITPVTRPADYIQFDYSSGASATVDLLQGAYKVRVSSTTPANSEIWTETVSIPANGRVKRSLTAPALVNTLAPTYSLTVFNNTGDQIRVWEFLTALSAGLNSGANATYANINGCAQITVRMNAGAKTGQLLDSFVYPNSGNYTIRYHTSVFNATVTNQAGVNQYVVAYKNNQLLGIVADRGNRRSKTFPNIKQNDSLTFYDGQGGSLDPPQSMPGLDDSFDY